MTMNPTWAQTAWEVLPVFRCAEDNVNYTGELGIASFSGDNTITVTMDADISSDLNEGNLVDIPDDNAYVAGGWYIAYGISGSTFKIQGTELAPYAGAKSLEDVDERWELPTWTKGSAKPGSCTDEDWFWDTDEAETDVYWCVGNAWTKREVLTTPSSDGTTAAIHAEAGAAKYWFRGVKITHHPTPQEGSTHPTDWAGGETRSDQGLIPYLAYLDDNTTDIVFEQCWFDGRGYPSRATRPISMLGEGPLMVKDSSFEDFRHWVWDRYSQRDGSTAIGINNGGPIRIENNLLESSAITVFATNRNIDGQTDTPHDITIQRNTFRRQSSWRQTTGDIDSPTRHHIEGKQGLGVRIIGNYFDYQYASTNTGATISPSQESQSIVTTPHSESIASFTNGVIDVSGGDHFLIVGDVVYITGAGNNHDGLFEVASLTDDDTFVVVDPPTGTGSAGTVYLRGPGNDLNDWYVGYNLVHEGTDFFNVQGNSQSSHRLPPIPRIQIEHNLVVDMNLDTYATGGRQSINALYAGSGFSGCRMVSGMVDVQDVTVTHNSLYGCWGLTTTALAFSNTARYISGLLLSDNLFKENEGGATDNFIRSQSSHYGSAALNNNVVGGQGWTSLNNAICCGWSAVSGDYDASWLWPASDAAVDWHIPQVAEGFDFRLADASPYKSGGATPASDGLDIGVDVDELDVQRGVVSNFRVRSIATTTATVSYLAPDSDACIVEHSTSATWGTGTRTGDGGGDRVRNVDLTSLTTGTLYYVRALCRTEQPNGTFTTQ